MTQESNLNTDDLLVRRDDAADEPTAAESRVSGGGTNQSEVDERTGDGSRTSRGEDDPGSAPLFAADDAERYREQWRDVQGQFVDRPREAVEGADHLVAELMQRLAAQFSESRQGLERQWDGNDDVSTEDLRVAMTRYRSFFERLLSA